jgi:hypothetical protein
MDPSNGGGRVPRQRPGPNLATTQPPSRVTTTRIIADVADLLAWWRS